MDGCRSLLALLTLTRWSTLPTSPPIRLPHWFLSAGSCCPPNLVHVTSNFTSNQNTAHSPQLKPLTMVSPFGSCSRAAIFHDPVCGGLQPLNKSGVLYAESNRPCALQSTTTSGVGTSLRCRWTCSPPRLRPQTQFTDVQHGCYARPRLRLWSIIWFANSFAPLSRSGLPRRGHRLFGNVISFW